MIFQYKTTTLKHNRTWTTTPSPNGLGGHIKVGQETPEGCSKVRNDFMDSYIIIDVPTKLKKSCCNSKRASVIQVLACSALCLCYLNLPNKVKYYNDTTLSVTQHFWRPLGPKGQFSKYHKL